MNALSNETKMFIFQDGQLLLNSFTITKKKRILMNEFEFFVKQPFHIHEIIFLKC